MCRISINKKFGDITMSSGGTSTRTAQGPSGNMLTHHWLPIQTTGIGIPFINTDDGSVILFNGEIFAHGFSDDMECIRNIYNEDGIMGLTQYLFHEADGFFSLIIDMGDRIFAMTDPLGKKQLYYKDGVGIASELKALVKENEPYDEGHFARTIKFGYVTDQTTPYKKIRRLKPNSLYVFDKDLDLIQVNPEIAEIEKFFGDENTLYQLMDKSVSNRLIGHKPIALLLSGGLDSSIICHHLQNQDANVQTYCTNNESDVEHARLIDPNVKIIEVPDGSIELSLLAMEQPLDLGSMAAQHALMSTIEETVVLTGDGADELFGGYRRMQTYDSQLSDIYDELPYYHHIRLDRMAAAFTKEIRSPFLNLDVVGFALSLPYQDRIDKSYLRRTYETKLPQEIVYREKEPLKSDVIRNSDPVLYRTGLVNLFKEIRNVKRHH